MLAELILTFKLKHLSGKALIEMALREQASPPLYSRRILVIRDDKLGDVILATPVLESLRKKFPGAYIAILVRPATYQAVQENPFIDEIILDGQSGWRGIVDLAKRIAQRRFDTVVILFCSARASFSSLLAGIPRRIGPSSRWPQIFLTHRIRQKRSRCNKHEADYNLDLAAGLGVEPVRATKICINELTERKVDNLFSKLKVKKNIPLIGLHPGSGGTSRRWKVECYCELIKLLNRSGRVQYFITHGPGEENMINKLIAASSGNLFFHPQNYGILEMAEIINRCSVFVSAGTGPMHVASAVGTPIVALFCPVLVCGEKRWGPYSVPYRLFSPDVPSCNKCREEKCPYFDCMDRIPAEKVAFAIREFLSPGNPPGDRSCDCIQPVHYIGE